MSVSGEPSSVQQQSESESKHTLHRSTRLRTVRTCRKLPNRLLCSVRSSSAFTLMGCSGSVLIAIRYETHCRKKTSSDLVVGEGLQYTHLPRMNKALSQYQCNDLQCYLADLCLNVIIRISYMNQEYLSNGAGHTRERREHSSQWLSPHVLRHTLSGGHLVPPDSP